MSGRKESENRREQKDPSRKNAVVYTAEYKVNRSDELLPFLLRKLNTSRNNVKTLLSNGQILVNGSVVTQYNFVLAKDDEVKISKKRIASAPSGPDGRERVRRVGNDPTAQLKRRGIGILYEDEDFIAIDKPAGLLSVENEKERECAFAYVFEYLRSRGKDRRPFILHRIDKETSGVLVFAKDVKIHSLLKTKWNESVTTREYYAVAEGVFKKKKDTVESFLKENKNHLMYSSDDPTGQKAITHYEVLKENARYSLLRVRIDTGRKNQIRVHLRDLSHPIVGDEKYGFTQNPLGRLGLHASAFAFVHPVTGRTITIVSPLPPSFKALF